MECDREGQNKARKQVPLRLSPTLYAQLTAWAEEEFRSLNGQIEYLLTECVRHRRGAVGSSSRAENGPSDSGDNAS